MWEFIKGNAPIISPLLLVVIGFTNLYIAILVFKFNKRNAYSKVSIQPIQAHEKEMSHRMGELHEAVYKEGVEIDGRGFSNIRDTETEWKIKIMNKGALASTNITLKYSLIIEKSKFDYDEDTLEVSNHKFVQAKRIDRTIHIPYISADGEKEITLLRLDGKIPKAKLIVNELKTSENTFIKLPVIIDEYKHSMFDALSDMAQYRALLGAHEYKTSYSNEVTVYR